MENKYIKLNNKYIVGVSGGPDSMYLLANLTHKFQNYLDHLIIVHINYQKRDSAVRDQQIVTDFCFKNNLKFYCKLVTEKDYQKYYPFTHNFQTIARAIRYDYFNLINEQEKANGVIIAHNMNDKIETYFLQKERNNIVEHYGLNQKSKYYSQFFMLNVPLTIFRPMLNITRSQIEYYLDINNITYGIDETNLLGIYRRNILRQQLKEKDFPMYLSLIKLANEKIKLEKNIVKEFLGSNNKIIVSKFNLINNLDIQQRILYEFFKKQKAIYLINNKKKQYLLEVIKQLKVTKHNHLIKINNEFVLVKCLDQILIYPSNYFEPLTIKVNNLVQQEQLIKWKESLIIFKKTNRLKQNVINASSFPLLITNDQSILKNTKFQNITLKDYWTKNKTDIFLKYFFWIIDVNNNCLSCFSLEKIKKTKKFNFMVK